MISFFVPGVPRPQGSKVAFVQRGKAVMLESSKGLKSWRRDIGQAALAARKQSAVKIAPKGSPVEVELTFYFDHDTTLPPDLDKLMRAVLDALTGVLWADDSQVTEALLRKRRTDDSDEGVVVVVYL